MTKNVLRNLFTRSATRLYPFVKRDIFENVRGALDIEIDKCIFCKACQLRCPARCISVDSKAGIWSFDPMVCVACGVCVAVCPKKCLHIGKQYRAPLLSRGIISHQGTPRAPKPKPDAPAAGSLQTPSADTAQPTGSIQEAEPAGN